MAPTPPVPPVGPDPVQALVRVTLGAPELGDAGPLTLRIGQRLLAEVLAVQAETGRTILSLAGRRLEAQLPPGARPGDVLRLIVADALPDRLVFRLDSQGAAPPPGTPSRPVPLATLASVGAPALGGPAAPNPPVGAAAGPVPSAVPLDAAAVLASLDLPDSPPLRASVAALMEQRLPLSRELLTHIRSAITPLSGDPLVNARAAVFLLQEGLPLTPRALALARAAAPGSPAAPLGAVLARLVQTMSAHSALDAPSEAAPAAGPAASGPRGPLAEATEPIVAAGGDSPDTALEPFSTTLRRPPAGGPDARGDVTPRAALLRLAATVVEPREMERAINTLSRAPEALVLASADVRRAVRPDPAAPPLPAPHGGADQPPPAPPPARLTPRAALDASAVAPQDPEPEMRSTGASEPAAGPLETRPAGESGDARTLLRALAEALPDSEARDLAILLHDRIELQQLRTAARALSPSEPVLVDDAAIPGTPSARTGDPTPSPLVVSLPLAFGGHLHTLELVVERDAPERRAASGDAVPGIRARFTLELRNLGEIAGDIRLHGAAVRCRLRAAERAAGQLAGAVDRLRERLERAGLDVQGIDCVVAEPSPPLQTPAPLRRVTVEA